MQYSTSSLHPIFLLLSYLSWQRHNQTEKKMKKLICYNETFLNYKLPFLLLFLSFFLSLLINCNEYLGIGNKEYKQTDIVAGIKFKVWFHVLDQWGLPFRGRKMSSSGTFLGGFIFALKGTLFL